METYLLYSYHVATIHSYTYSLRHSNILHTIIYGTIFKHRIYFRLQSFTDIKRYRPDLTNYTTINYIKTINIHLQESVTL